MQCGVIIFNKAKHGESPSWLKVSKHKIQEIDTTLYNNLSHPVVMTKEGISPIQHASVSSYCPGHASCLHGWSLSLQSPDWAMIWDCSRSQSGEMLGNSTSQRERRQRAERLPGGEAGDPAECKICRGRRVSIGQELNLTDTAQQ